jgi:FkbM family methyltransferase
MRAVDRRIISRTLFQEQEMAMLDYLSLHEKGVSTGGAFFEKIIEATYTFVLQGGETVIDCGANWGQHTEPLSRRVGPDGMVIAIEPIARLADELIKKSMRNVKVIQAAVGRQDLDQIEFFDIEKESSLSSLRKPSDHPSMTDEFIRSAQVIKVPLMKLDTLVAENGLKSVRFIKMDLEGGEFDALNGAVETLAKARPLVVFECGFEYSAKLFGFTRHDFFAFFERNGYSVFDLFGRRFAPDLWGRPGYPWYLFAAPRLSRDEDYLSEIHPNVVARVNAV